MDTMHDPPTFSVLQMLHFATLKVEALLRPFADERWLIWGFPPVPMTTEVLQNCRPVGSSEQVLEAD